MNDYTVSLGARARGRGLRASVPTAWVLLVCAALVYLGAPTMDGRGDPDFYWHLLYARWMLEHGGLPTTDFLSWTFEGKPYLLTQWLGQLVIGATYFSVGAVGTALLTLACVVGVVVLAWSVCERELEHPLVAFVVAAAATATFWSTYARPQMLGFVCMMVMVGLADRGMAEGWTRARVVAASLLMVLWVNCHGSYVVGLVYLAVLCVGQAVEALFMQEGLGTAWRRCRGAAAVLLLCLAATLVNPYGWWSWGNVVEIAGLQSTTTGIIMEWAPTSFGTAVGSTYILLLLGTTLAMALGSRKPSIGDLVVTAAMGVFGLLAARQAYYATLALVPVLARAISGTELAALANRSLSVRMPAWIGTVAVVLCLGIGQYANTIRAKGIEAWQRKIFPVEALAFVRNSGVQGKVFNEVTAGGWLAYHGRMKVFVDGRMDLYKDQAFFEWFFTRMGAPGWQERLQSSGAEVFILQNQSPLTQLLLQSGGHALVHSDDSYAVILPRIPKFQPVIEAHTASLSKFRIFGDKGNLVATPLGW